MDLSKARVESRLQPDENIEDLKQLLFDVEIREDHNVRQWFRQRAFALAWAAIAVQVAGEFANGFGEGVGKRAADLIFGANDSYTQLSTAALNQIRDIIKTVLDERDVSKCLDLINGVSGEMAEWRRAPETPARVASPAACLRILNTEVLPTLTRMGAVTLGTYVLAINCKLTILNLFEGERENAKSTLTQSINTVDGEWISQAVNTFRDSLDFDWKVDRRGGRSCGEDCFIEPSYIGWLNQHGDLVWTGPSRDNAESALRDVEREVESRYAVATRQQLDEPFLNSIRETVKNWRIALSALG